MNTNAAPRGGARFAVSVACGLLAGLRAYLITVSASRPRDFGQVWFAARALLAGSDPYAMIGPGQLFEWTAPFVYPLTAAVAAIPLAPLSSTWAPIVFTAFACGCFAWALMEHGYGPLVGFLSATVVFAAELAQWSPLLAAATVITPVSMLYVSKPTIGAAMFVARPSWWAVGGGIALVLAAFAFEPNWIGRWSQALLEQRIPRAEVYPYVAPVTRPGSIVAILCLLRWRRREARLVAALACVPQTPMLYEAVPLFLVPRTAIEAVALVASSYVAMTLMAVSDKGGFGATPSHWDVALFLLYAPCSLMVLRRPNAGTLPVWLETRLPRVLPSWLRGSA